jgi:hypothetical protein
MMQKVDLTKPSEKKKLIWAGILGLAAILFLWWTLFGFGSSTTPSKPATSNSTNARSNQRPTQGTQPPSELTDLTSELQDVSLEWPHPQVPEPRRNIFAYYEPPPPVEPKASPTPTPTPTPTPPVLLAQISPATVYAKTSDFTLEVAGDRFTPEMKIFLDVRELPTKYRSPQQLSAVVPAALILNPGTRQVAVRTSDGRMYSNALALNVAAPPVPNFTYIGLSDTIHRVSTAWVQDKSSRDVLSVQRGDLIGGRFRVTSISEKELVLVDNNLKIRHTLAMTEGERSPGSSPLARPTPRVDAEDDEP